MGGTIFKLFHEFSYKIPYVTRTDVPYIIAFSSCDNDTLYIFQVGKSPVAAFNIHGWKMSIKRFLSIMYLSSCRVGNQTSKVVSN